jgi:hypothetical protein
VTPAPPPTGSMTAPAPARATAAEPVGEAPSYTG